MKVVPRPAAEDDLLEIYLYLGRTSPRAAERFFDAVAKTSDRIAVHPGLSSRLALDDPRLAGLRVCPVERFKSYLIFYRATDDMVDIVRVLHGARGDIERLLSQTLGQE